MLKKSCIFINLHIYFMEGICMYVCMYVHTMLMECIEFYYFACISSDSACFAYLYILIDIK